MKIILIITILSTCLFAQFEKKTIGINGNFTYKSGERSLASTFELSNQIKTESNFSSLSFSPTLSYFPFNYFSLGLLLTYNYSYEKHTSVVSTYYDIIAKSNSIYLGPEIRYYFKYYRIFPFITASYQFGVRVYNTELILNETEKESYNIKMIRTGVGLCIFITKSVAIEGLLTYHNENQKSSLLPANSSAESLEYNDKYLSFGAGLNFYLK